MWDGAFLIQELAPLALLLSGTGETLNDTVN